MGLRDLGPSGPIGNPYYGAERSPLDGPEPEFLPGGDFGSGREDALDDGWRTHFGPEQHAPEPLLPSFDRTIKGARRVPWRRIFSVIRTVRALTRR